LNAKEKENEPKERKTLSQRVATVRGKPPNPLFQHDKQKFFKKIWIIFAIIWTI